MIKLRTEEIANLIESETLSTEDFNSWLKSPKPMEVLAGLKMVLDIFETEKKKPKELIKWKLKLSNFPQYERIPKKAPVFKSKIYINGKPIKFLEINLITSEIKYEEGNNSFHYPLALTLAVLLKRLKPNWDIAISKSLEKDKEFLFLNGVFFNQFFEYLSRYKQYIKHLELHKLPIWGLLYFRPPFLSELARGILLYYLNAEGEEKRLLEEYYTQVEDLTAEEEYIKKAMEIPRKKEIEEIVIEEDKDAVVLALDEELREKVNTELRIRGFPFRVNSRLVIPTFKWESYLEFSPPKGLIEELVDIVILREIHTDLRLLREKILKNQLEKDRETRLFLAFPT